VATTLANEGHEVAIIDKNPEAFRRLGTTFRGQAIEGVAFDQAVLERAGIRRADGFATVTNGDNTNYVLAAMARWHYQVPRVVARIYDPLRADIYRQLGVPTVSSTVWGANRIRELLTYAELTPVLEVASGEVQVVEVEVSPLLDGHSVAELNVPEESQVVAIVRSGQGFIPTPATILRAHDLLYVAVRSLAIGRLEAMVGT
jgi:trk system potassium uptake protein TrkA